MEYQVSTSLSLKDIVYQRVYEYLESQERRISIEELLQYLIETNIESKRFLAKEDLKLPAGGMSTGTHPINQ